MLRLLTILALVVRVALLQKRPPGPGGGGSTGPGGRPPQRHGSVDAGAGVTSAQNRTREFADDGTPPDSGSPSTNPPETQPESPSQWDGVEGTPPRVEDIHLDPGRRVHILDGDGDGVGGGHAPGTGLPNKTEFPERWDDDVIAGNIEDVARNPDHPPVQQDNDRWVARGTRDGVEITVVIEPDGRIWTAYPEGGDGVVRNDEHGNPIP